MGLQVDLVVKIYGSSEGAYELVFSDWKFDGNYNYKHSGGTCPTAGACTLSGPQWQHNDPVMSDVFVGTLNWRSDSAQQVNPNIDRGQCTSHGNDVGSFGWHGCCGYSQFAGQPDGGSSLIHTIDKNGVYRNPPVQGVSKKEMFLRVTY